MRRALAPLALVAALAGCGKAADEMMPIQQAEAAAPEAGAGPRGDARHPVVLELFQSQGCSSCPPANANINALADRADVLALNFSVTYWDQLGWKDRFASPAFTARQWDYAHAGRREQVYTPQVVINGFHAVTGIQKPQLDAAMARSGPVTGVPAIDAMVDRKSGSGRVELAAGPTGAKGPATVWLVEYDPRVREVAISAGENNGRTLPHRNIVRRLVSLGAWSGKAASLALVPLAEAGDQQAVLVQQGKGGPIISARKL